MMISVFCFAQLDRQSLSEFTRFRKLIQSEFHLDPFIVPCQKDIDDDSLTIIKQHAKISDAIIFIMENEKSNGYFYGLGLGDGILTEKSKPVLFLYTKEAKSCNCNRFMLYLDDLKNEAINKAVLCYLKNDAKDFWINYAIWVVEKFKKLSINLDILQEGAIEEVWINEHPADYPTDQLDILIARTTTSNFEEFSLSFFAQKHPDAIYNRESLLRIFICYSKSDIVHKNKLRKHLSLLRDKIVIFEDQDLMPGDDWDTKIKEELEKADIVLYLVSAESMATEYIQTIELPMIEARCQKGVCKLVPVIVRSCGWTSLDFAKYNALPDKDKPVTSEEHWKNEDDAWLKVVEGVERLVDAFRKRQRL